MISLGYRHALMRCMLARNPMCCPVAFYDRKKEERRRRVALFAGLGGSPPEHGYRVPRFRAEDIIVSLYDWASIHVFI